MGDERAESLGASLWPKQSKNFAEQVGNYLTYSPVYRAQGILKAAKDDYANDQLFELRQVIEAEVFDDFLEQAEHLLYSGITNRPR